MIMKTTLLLASFVCLFVCLASISAAAQKPAPPAAVDSTPDQWKEYSYSEDNVGFRLPAAPEITKVAKDNRHRYEYKSAVNFELTVSDAGIDVGKDRGIQQRYLFLMSLSLDEELKTSGDKLIKREDTKVDGNPALFIQIESKDGLVTRSK